MTRLGSGGAARAAAPPTAAQAMEPLLSNPTIAMVEGEDQEVEEGET